MKESNKQEKKVQTTTQGNLVEEKLTDKEKLKAEITRVKASLSNLAETVEKCEKIKAQKRLVLSEDGSVTKKSPEEVFTFAVSGDIVIAIMNIIDNFLGRTKTQLLEDQNKIIDKLNEYL